MLFKKINIIYIVIAIIIVLSFKTLIFSKYELNYCFISNEKSFEPFSSEKNLNFQTIKTKLRNEVIDLEKQRELLINEISSKNSELSKLHNEVYQYSIKSYRIRNSIISLSQIRKDFQRRHKNGFDFKPIISKFKDISFSVDFNVFAENKTNIIDLRKCSTFSCFNFQHCPFKSLNKLTISIDNSEQKGNNHDLILEAIKKSHFYSKSNACVILTFSSTFSIEKCKNLNCVLISNRQSMLFPHKSIISSSFFHKNYYRHNFDIVIPVLSAKNEISNFKLPMIFPLKRRYFLSFTASVDLRNLPKIDRFVLKYFQNISDEIQKETGNNNFYFDINCLGLKSSSNFSDWDLCENAENRLKRLSKSKFCLILSHWNSDILTTDNSQRRVIECLLSGSIPVVLGDVLFPFHEIIDWSRAALVFPKQRAMEIINILQNIPDNEVIEMKLFGRKVLEMHFLNVENQIDSIGYVLTKRLGLSLPLSSTYPADFVASRTKVSYYNFSLPNLQMEMDPYLGPNNIPPTNSRNVTNNIVRSSLSCFANAYHGCKFNTYPSTPWDPVLPTDSVLRGFSSKGFYGINHSRNEAGTEFMHSLGGNHVYEQFTLVILSFKRHSLLRKSLEMLNGLPYLHSIVIVWNDPSPPEIDFKLPQLHVDIKMVKGEQNSLNNRFLPYDIIQTDAILSFDDDIQLRHDEIIFAFRVWRENRDRIVGFPARYHNEYPGPTKLRYPNEQWWMYNSNYTCEYSMVLTGAAFFHRFYLFAYSNDMNPAIRQIVNKYKNCEDIAMNFLVSHITRKPPLKVTVRWTFTCVNCDSESGNMDNSLHNRPDHYQIRSNCINEFSAIYGYNPLLYSQYRADSVLFKTRLPVDKQKCFRYV